MKDHCSRAYPVHRSPCPARQRLAVCCALFSTTVLVLFANTLFAVPAHARTRSTIDADSGSVERTYRVSYRDLDLAQPRHVIVLHNRVKAAARDLCHATPEMISNDESFEPTCFVAAVADGKRQIDRAVIDALDERGKDAVVRDRFTRLP